MAQWMGQYSGNTHGSRVRELESQLRHAIDVSCGGDTDTDLGKQRRKIERMADRLLSARIRARKSNTQTPNGGDDPKLRIMIDGGVAAILLEFGVETHETRTHSTQDGG